MAKETRLATFPSYSGSVVMGFGLLYLNMPDPQPRERHYVLEVCIWHMLFDRTGRTAIIEWMRPRLERFHGGILIALSAIALLLPLGTAVGYTTERSKDYIAYDYAQYAHANPIAFFTNGDNDTFPCGICKK